MLKGNSEGSVKSGEKAANRWTQLWWQTGMSSMCYSVKMKRSRSPQSHPSVLVTADNFPSKKRRLPWFAPHTRKKAISRCEVKTVTLLESSAIFSNLPSYLHINFKYIKLISAWGFDEQQSRHQRWHLWLITSRNVHVNVWKQGNNKFAATPSGAGTFQYISYYGPSLLMA